MAPPPAHRPSSSSERPLAREVRARIAALIAAHAGLAVPDWVLDARVHERLAALGLHGPDAGAAYLDRLADPGAERERAALIEALRVGETRFFRHAAHVRALLDVVVPAVARARAGGQRVVRAWSMGCATGEEAYTLAMILDAALGEHEVRVLGTDVSERALALARAGVYSAAAVAHVPEPWRSAAFVPVPGADHVQVAPALRRQVSFVRHNLIDRSEPEGWEGSATSAGFDVIWCRNVLIYFTPEARRQVLARCARALAGHGHLFVGYAESLRATEDFAAVRTAGAVLYRRARATASGASARVEGASVRIEGASVRIEGASARVEGAGARVEGASVRIEGASVRVEGASVRLEGAGARLEDASERREGASGLAGEVNGRVSGAAPGAAGLLPAVSVAGVVSGDAPAHALWLSGRYDSGERLARELRAVMARGPGRVVVELDGAELLGEDAAAVLRRAQRAARAAGAELHVRATRPGARRWMRRHGLDRAGSEAGEGAPVAVVAGRPAARGDGT